MEKILLIEELRDLPFEPGELHGILLENDLMSFSSEEEILSKLGLYYMDC